MSLGASFVQRVSGFGFGIFIMTVLPLIMPTYGEATTLSGMLSIMTAVQMIPFIWKNINLKKLIPIMLTFLLTSWVAVQFVASTGDSTLKHILGITLIVTSLWLLFLNSHIKVKPTLPIQISMGTLSGFMGGLFGMQGPPAVLYFLATADRKDQYMALTQTYFLIGNVMMTIFRAQSGFLTANVGWAWCGGVVAVLIGAWIGGKVYEKIPPETLRKIIYIYMAISGVVALLS